MINLTKICNYKWAAPVMYGTSSAGEKSEKQKASARGRGFFDVLLFSFPEKEICTRAWTQETMGEICAAAGLNEFFPHAPPPNAI